MREEASPPARQPIRPAPANPPPLRPRRTARLSCALDLSHVLNPNRPPCVATFTDLLPFAIAITLADDAREAAQAVAAAEAAGGAMSRLNSGMGLGMGTTSRRSTRLAGIAPYKHKITWDREDGDLVRALGLLA